MIKKIKNKIKLRKNLLIYMTNIKIVQMILKNFLMVKILI